ncbi:prenyltransferase/squalene oxidase repeat-containing protein [Streptomyces klenkii]|uniref:prenyltransferase/squalene oxidase repeat-containing protein n=1 Tax=Streptomyces klenkii TaxID=1420899 RepID=UPI0033E74D64
MTTVTPKDASGEFIGMARQLVSTLSCEPWGNPSPSVYETARLVTLAPWLNGQTERISHLLHSRRADGGWGGTVPKEFALVPTLSAAEALLTTLQRAQTQGLPRQLDHTRLTQITDRALRLLFAWLSSPDDLDLPDTHAIELVVPYLVTAINQHLDDLQGTPLAGIGAGHARLRLPGSLDPQLLDVLRSRLAAGESVPDKALYSLETSGAYAHQARGIQPVPPGTVGASPAATAAWLGKDKPEDPHNAAVRYLNAVATRYEGLAPAPIPIAQFERVAVLGFLARAGLRPAVSAELLSGIEIAIGPTGTAGGAGLPVDGDTTAIALVTLAELGIRHDPACLFTYERDDHFCTWPGERTPAPSTNSHQLEALGQYLARGHPNDTARYRRAVKKISAWICGQQREEGSWDDKWHASPYYPTVCCALALDRYGTGNAATTVHKAVDWVLATQRGEGSWGRWQGTIEETAYAMLTLLLTRHRIDKQVQSAVARGSLYLQQVLHNPDNAPLWTGKDLYFHQALAMAPAVAALHLAQSQPAAPQVGQLSAWQ